MIPANMNSIGMEFIKYFMYSKRDVLNYIINTSLKFTTSQGTKTCVKLYFLVLFLSTVFFRNGDVFFMMLLFVWRVQKRTLNIRST